MVIDVLRKIRITFNFKYFKKENPALDLSFGNIDSVLHFRVCYNKINNLIIIITLQ